jgi:hypothetical protein
MRAFGALVGGVAALGILLVAVVVLGLGAARSVDAVSARLPPGSDAVSAVGAEYDPVRLTAGLGVAALLLATAALFVHATDWSAVGEAAAPEIDDVEYADLDAIVAALEDDESSNAVTRDGPRDRLSE